MMTRQLEYAFPLQILLKHCIQQFGVRAAAGAEHVEFWPQRWVIRCDRINESRRRFSPRQRLISSGEAAISAHLFCQMYLLPMRPSTFIFSWIGQAVWLLFKFRETFPSPRRARVYLIPSEICSLRNMALRFQMTTHPTAVLLPAVGPLSGNVPTCRLSCGT